MARVPKVTTLTQPIWPDKTIYAAMFADQPPRPDHATPQAADPDWTSLVNDYVSQSDNISQFIKPSADAVPLGLRTANPSAISDLFPLQDYSGQNLVRADYTGKIWGRVADFLLKKSAITVDSNANSVAVTTAAGTTTISVTKGHEVIVGVAINSGVLGTVVSTIADTVGTVYVKRGVLTHANGDTRVELWSARAAATNASNVITVTLNQDPTIAWIISAYSLFGPMRAGNVVTSSGTGTAQTVTGVTQDTNNYVVAVVGISTLTFTGDTFASVTGTIRSQATDSVQVAGALVDNTSVSAGNVVDAVSGTDPAEDWCMVAVEYRTAVLAGDSVPNTDTKIKFVDIYGSGHYDNGDSVVYDTNNNGKYDAGEPVISGATPAINTTLTADTKFRYFSFAALNNAWVTNCPVTWSRAPASIYNATALLQLATDLTLDGAFTAGGNATIGGNLVASGTGQNSVGGPFTVNGYLRTSGVLTSFSRNAMVDVGAFATLGAGQALNGLYFQPGIIIPNGITPGVISPVFASTNFQSSGGVGATPELNMFTAQEGHTLTSALTLTKYRAFWSTAPARLGGSIDPTITDYYGLDLDAAPAFATNKWGIRQSGANDPNRLSGKTRIGDQTTPKIGLEAVSGFGVNVLAKSANYTMLATDYVILATGGAGGITITLPAANAGASGVGQKIIVIKVDAGAGAVTVSRAGADTVEGAVSLSLLTQYKKAELISDNVSVWYDLGAGLV